MPTKNGMNVLDTDASVVAISGILHQDQQWEGKTVLRPIAYGIKVFSDTEMGTQSGDVRSSHLCEKYRVYLGSERFKLRVDNRTKATSGLG